jgi:broad specificity phosphatase PhoE
MTLRRSTGTLALLAVALLAAAPAPAVAPATVVLLVRHAERAPGSGDVPISEQGRSRALALADIGKAAGVSAIVTTQFQRTHQTAAPLAEALGIPPVVVNTQSDMAKHAADVAAAVRQQPGKTVLVVGHSNTVAPIVAALGVPKFRDFCDPEYDNLVVMVLDAEGGVRTVRGRFGAATPVDSSCAAMR